jgi:hypothetical protein
MGTVGIIKALAKSSNNKNIIGYGSAESLLVELSDENNSFTAYVDESCLGKNTKNPQTTLNDTKWFVVREHIWNYYKNSNPKLTNNDIFLKIKSEINDFKTYTGREIKINKSHFEDFTPGVIHYLMPYSVFPEDKVCIRVVNIEKPQVLYCHFKLPEGGYLPLSNQQVRVPYGQTVEVVIYTHLVPNSKKSNEKFVFQVDLINKGEVLDSKKDLEIYYRNYFTYNQKHTVKFTINPEWQKNHNENKIDETYYLHLRGYVISRNGEYNPEGYVRPMIEYQSEGKKGWSYFKNGRWIFSTSELIYVPYDKIHEMMNRIETQKTNQIQKIGDVYYTQKEHDPCGYAKIIIKDEGGAKRESFTLFDEDAQVIDKTHNYFDIIRGDEKKEVLIKLEGLQNKEVLCTGVMLTPGEKHDIKENVFLMKLARAPQRTEDGKKYATKSDPTQEGDRDVYGAVDNKQYEVESIQGLKLNKDYEFVGENQLKLKLNFWYNKTVAEGFTSGMSQEILNTLWLFRYFFLGNIEPQTYFVPISTCRYPNQIAKIRVFPQIEWTFHLNYGMKNPLYYRDTWVEMRQHRVEAAFNKGQAADIDGYNGDLQTSFSLALECKWNKTETAKLDQKLADNIKLFVRALLKIKNFVDQVTGKDKGNSTEGLSADLLDRIKRKPLSIEIQSPKLSVAAGWKYEFGRKENYKNHVLATTYEIKAKADPLIGVEATIDLIAWGKKLHPAANSVITSLDLLAYAANAEVRFDLIFYGKLIIEGNTTLSSLKKDGQLKAEGRFGFKLILLATATGKLEKYFISVDIDFEAKAQAEGYFSAGLSLGLDDHKGIYFKPILNHSGIKISYSFYVKVNGYRRTKSDEKVIIPSGKADIDTKYYINE